MPLYRLALRMATDMPGQPARKWSNTLFLDAPNPTAAAAAGVVGWQSALRQAVRERVYCYEVYASDLVPGSDQFSVQPVPIGSQRGALASVTGFEPYMPKVCIAVTLLAEAGRPSRKFWRPGLYESDVGSGVSLNETLVEQTRDAWTAFLNSSGSNPYSDPDGQAIIGVGRIRLTTREFGREATVDVPLPPPLG